ncbi:glycosyltransferase family 2 protein [Marinitoga litoralis]|uniref:glycosyltransferase family 2 protein n=1 Tax=Marinitoga litoralis TaxID=570855 RepID=UPI0019600421|nr:glycosyltransferase family A protein [Marinitoga litoralis]MBM7560308.1 glycosyltransferase involved in cell wall biosynthesis [Marinitoga litoralis]
MQNNVKSELLRIYKNLIKEIKEYKNKVENVRSYSKNSLQNIVCRENNTDTIISVVTPAYNAEKFLPKLYKSLKRQTIAKQLEWVIIDDYSNDNVMNFYEQLSCDNSLGKINIYRNEKNLGAAMSLKKGFSLTSSNIVAWVSADDFYVSIDKLEQDLRLINAGYDLIFSAHTFIGDDILNSRMASVNNKKYRDKYHMVADLMFGNYLNGSSICMKKDAYLDSGGINEFLINVDGDFDLWVKDILLNKKIGFSNTAVFNYSHPGQTSKVQERMIVGKNITRLSYIRFLNQSMGNEWFEQNFKIFFNIKAFTTEDILKIQNYFPWIFLSQFIWVEEASGKEHYYTKLLRYKYSDIFEMNELFKKQIYELSDEFMKSDVFQIFAKKYKEIDSVF